MIEKTKKPMMVCAVSIKTGQSIVISDIVSYKVAYSVEVTDWCLIQNLSNLEVHLKYDERLGLSDCKFLIKDYVLFVIDSGFIINSTIHQNMISN